MGDDRGADAGRARRGDAIQSLPVTTAAETLGLVASVPREIERGVNTVIRAPRRGYIQDWHPSRSRQKGGSIAGGCPDKVFPHRVFSSHGYSAAAWSQG